MKTLLLSALIFCTLSTKATNYYFSQAAGNDSRSAAQAQNPATPWKTLSKLNLFFTSLKPGDSVLLKRNEIFYGSINVTKSGTIHAPIVIGAYGKGNKPVITSFITLTDWSSKGNGIWESNNSSLEKTVNVVLLNNLSQQTGRFPNIDAENSGYLNFESHNKKTSITDNELSTKTDWSGAKLVLRGRRWIIDVNTIKSNTANTISYVTTSKYEPYDKYGYFIQNSIKTLDKDGEWYYNPATKKLSIYSGTRNPGSSAVQATSLNNLISINNNSFVTVDNISLKGANETAIDIRKGANISIKECDITHSGQNGITAYDNLRLVIENCAVANSYNNGIDLGYSSHYAIIRNNSITNTSMVAGMGQNGDGRGISIFSNGNNCIIEYNKIINSGYIGISYDGSDVTVKNNLVDNFCLVKDDGSGIYSHGSASKWSIPLFKNRKVTGNIVINGLGAGPGTNRPFYFCASGIYLDNKASATEIVNNTFINCSLYGIFIHNSLGMIIKNNVLYNNNKQMSMNQDPDNSQIRNNIITNNIFFSKYPTQMLTNLISTGDDISLFGRWDSNYYARPLDERMSIYAQYRKTSMVKHTMDLEGWQENFDEDKGSKSSCRAITPYKINKLTGSNKVSDKSLSSESSVSLSIGALTKGKNYVLSFGLKGSGDKKEYLAAYLNNNSPAAQYRRIGTSHANYEMLFTSLSTVSSGKLVFSVDSKSKFYLDNITFHEADAKITNPDDSIRCDYNATNFAKSITLSGSYVDVKGNSYSKTAILQPYTSLILIKASEDKHPASAPSVVITSPTPNVAFKVKADITISAAATDTDGSVYKVEFYIGARLLKTEYLAPFACTWQNVPAGNYILTARAIDNDGLATTSAPVAISVKASVKTAPVVSITAPAENTHFALKSDITISVDAADTDGSVYKVEFFNGTVLLKTEYHAPFGYTWQNVAAGNYTLTARATDNDGLSATSSPVTISVAGAVKTAPVVSITSPVENAHFNAQPDVIVSAAATDADGSVYKVEFFNGTTLLKTEYLAPFAYTWQNVPAGKYSITARATDDDGLSTTSSPVTISVARPVKAAPSVSLTSPVESANFKTGSDILISAAANDADGSIYKIEFFNGTILLKTEYVAPFTFTWKNVPAGDYIITARATDNDRLTTTSLPVGISVGNLNMPPTVSIVSPVMNTNFTSSVIDISVVAEDADGSIVKVEYYNKTGWLWTDYAFPYYCTWSNVPAGTYTLIAKATDNKGAVTISEQVIITVGLQQAARGASTGYNNFISAPVENTLNLNGGKIVQSPAVSVYPNPAADLVYLAIGASVVSEKATLLIRNSSGIIVKRSFVNTSEKNIPVNISFLPNGVYTISLSGDTLNINKTFVKVK